MQRLANNKSPDPVDVEVGSRLRARRKSMSMSRIFLAEAIGLTFQQIQKYEHGTNRMGASRLQQIADVLNVPPTFFFDGDAPVTQNNQDPLSAFVASAEGSALARSFSKIESKALRRRIVRLVEELVRIAPTEVVSSDSSL